MKSRCVTFAMIHILHPFTGLKYGSIQKIFISATVVLTGDMKKEDRYATMVAYVMETRYTTMVAYVMETRYATMVAYT